MNLFKQARRLMYLDIMEDRPLTAEETKEKNSVQDRIVLLTVERGDILGRLAIGKRRKDDVDRLYEIENLLWGEVITKNMAVYDALDGADRILAEADKLIEKIKAKLDA